MKKTQGQILRLLKDVRFTRPRDSVGNERFFAGRPGPFGRSSYGAKWWFAKDYWISLRNLSSQIRSECEEYKNCNEESISSAIQDTLQLVCMDNDIFDGGFLSGYESLFTRIKSGKEKDAARKIFAEITSMLESKIEDTVCIYLVPTISAKSFYVPEEELHFVNKEDNTYLEYLQNSGIFPKRLSISSGEIEGGFSTFTRFKFKSILLLKAKGSLEDVEVICEEKIRRFFAVVFSKVRSRISYPMHRSGLEVSGILKQFVNVGTPSEDYRYSTIGIFCPAYFEKDFELPTVVTKKVRQWYSNCSDYDQVRRNRKYVGAHYINLGMNAKSETSFILYFIALDAIFGVRGDVERSILEGVEAISPDGVWLDKISWLYDLRNNLIHGGCRNINGWKKYSRYRSHFDSEPLIDLEKLSCISLLG